VTDSTELQIAREFDEHSIARIAEVAALKPGAHIHISGICGTGTGAVLQLLKNLGYRVTGSDKAFYPPMGDVVRQSADKLYEGYQESNLEQRPDMVIIGNVLSRNNPEVDYILRSDIPFASMPEVLSALLIGDRDFCRTSIVVTGTHGKTTTTAICAWVLEVAKRNPGYFIGGVPCDFPTSIRPVDSDMPADSRVVVTEGDEYDSAFFAKFSKFHCYRPDIAIITSLEFDHADIYVSLDEIENEFDRFVKLLPEDGLLLVADTSPRLDGLVKRWKEDSQVVAKIARYGERQDSDFRLEQRSVWCYQQIPKQCFGQQCEVFLEDRPVTIQMRLSGKHNVYNMLAVAAVGQHLGIGEVQITEALRTFQGVKRRQEVIAEIAGITVIEDFAHHPTAVQTTLEGIRESFGPKRLLAVYEPRSNTSRRNVFQKQYARAFAAADLAVIKEVDDTGLYNETSSEVVPLDTLSLLSDVASRGTIAHSFKEVSEIEEFLLEELQRDDVVVLMSNGPFDGLPQSLPEALAQKYS